jgi:hypothetical protein
MRAIKIAVSDDLMVSLMTGTVKILEDYEIVFADCSVMPKDIRVSEAEYDAKGCRTIFTLVSDEFEDVVYVPFKEVKVVTGRKT